MMRSLRVIIYLLIILVSHSVADCADWNRALSDDLLKGKWSKVVDYFKNEPRWLDSDPVARILLAHALLAVNKNNDSMMLLNSSSKTEDLSAWAEWTASQEQQYPQNPVARYLSADAKVRLGSSEEAIKGFTQALEFDPQFALAQNARGVVYAVSGQTDKAYIDFYLTTLYAPDFADAYANWGVLAVFQESSISQGDAALQAFNKALEINPEFALAYNGRGCLYFGNQEYALALADFKKALSINPQLPIAEYNLNLISKMKKQETFGVGIK